MSEIEIHLVNLNERALALKQAGENFEKQTLNPLDEISTISANASSKEAFQEIQNAHQKLSVALTQSSENIKDIGECFFTLEADIATSFTTNLEGVEK